MSHGQENEMTRSLLRSQTAKELENQLLQLRKGELSQHKKKAERRTRRTLSRKELELPSVQPSSAHDLSKTKGDGNQGEKSAQSKFQSMALYGNNFERSTKPLAVKTYKWTDGTSKHRSNCLWGNCLESLENAGVSSPVFCGPCFRPWSRGKKEKRKYITHGDYKQQAANVQWFHLKHQRSWSECFNLTKVLSEVNEISRFNENRAKKELAPTTTSSEILMPALVGRGAPQVTMCKQRRREAKDWPCKIV